MSTTLPPDILPSPRARDGRPGATGRTVSLLLHVEGEARDLGWMPAQLPSGVDEVLVACSGTRGAPGRGDALRAGLAAATGEYIVMMDADGSMWPGEIPHLLYFLDSGYDLVRGSRCIAGGGSLDLSRTRALGNRLLRALANRIYHLHLTDFRYGFCAVRRGFLAELDLRSSGFDLEAEMIAHARRSGLRIAEVPSLELPRRSGRSHPHAVADGRRVLRTLLAERPGTRPPASAAGGEGMK